MVSPSRLVRLELEARFGALFNDALLAACDAFAVRPELRFAVNFERSAELPENYYREDRSLGNVERYELPQLPGLSMWVGDGRHEASTGEKPRLFSGVVAAYWRFFLYVEGLEKDGLVELREAVEAALVQTLDPQFPVFGYAGDLSWTNSPEKQILSQDQDHCGWAQECLFSGSFVINV